ncbi:hypothetical protein KQX54_012929 [Cotesia glomerata]|uniref:Uncharacterized protein n=1 Tax=Cotesia glomerata TaxID=32391 RepID=A0AAV7J3Q3_COTGL|nr:hypothetical protein KQX54_012929 [Cotesia glomerata]
MMFNHIVLIVISLAVAYFAIGESAGINSKIAPIHEVEPQFSPIVKRSSTLSERSCGKTMPCGCCKCDDGLGCVFGKEKLSTSAYLYYCTNTTSTDRLAPDHDISKPDEELYSLYSYVPRK